MASIGYLEIFIAFFFFLIFWFLENNKNGLPRNYPFFGMPPSLFLNFHRIHEWAGDVLSRTGGTFLLKDLWFTNMDILVTVDPANVHYIMSAKFQNIPKGPEFKKFFDVLGDGIFNSEEETESRVYRKQPLYHSQRRGMSGKKQREYAKALIINQRYHKFLVKTIDDKVKGGLIPILEFMCNKEDRIVDLQDVFKRFIFDICKLVTGFDPGSWTRKETK
nr:alkane hydroxylase MAH1-like [Nicotiana tomentosiformis]